MSGAQGKSQITLVEGPQAFFHELIDDAFKSRRLATQPETQFYLVNLLGQFITTDQLYTRDENGNAQEEPLALMLKEAMDQAQPEAKRSLLRHVGDVSLYVAGFFQDSLSRKLVDVDYYIGMGGTAYQHVASTTPEDVLRALYGELAEKFSSFVDILAEISDKTTIKNEKNLLRLYELWVRTRSERAAKALQEAGIIPNKTVGKSWQ